MHASSQLHKFEQFLIKYNITNNAKHFLRAKRDMKNLGIENCSTSRGKLMKYNSEVGIFFSRAHKTAIDKQFG